VRSLAAPAPQQQQALGCVLRGARGMGAKGG
jgi:hypothetical protein